jgi:FdhD protein
MPPDPVARTTPQAWRGGVYKPGVRVVPEETPVAITYGRMTYAVMMATPQDLEDFAVGFSLNERVVENAAEIEDLEVVTRDSGVELRMTIAGAKEDALIARRRHVAGATGCGLCGMESLAEALRPPPNVGAPHLRLSAEALSAVAARLAPAQTLNHRTHAVHAAGFWQPGNDTLTVREDVGRHNALDKVAGALARQNISGGQGVVLLTSRVSVEMVQKTAMIGAPILVAVSAPTALALRTAEQAGITLIAVARQDGFELFTHPERVLGREQTDVA